MHFCFLSDKNLNFIGQFFNDIANIKPWYDIKIEFHLNPIQDELFRGCSRMGGYRPPLPKTCHTYPTTMKLGTVIPHPKKIQKIYKSRDRPLELC